MSIMAVALTDEWCDLLVPWAQRLAPFVAYEARDELVYGTLHDRIDWLRLDLGSAGSSSATAASLSDDERWQELCELREAMELVALAVHYNKRVWKEFHYRLWKVHDPFRYDIDSAEVQPRWQLGFTQQDRSLGDSRTALADAVDLLTRIPPEVLSPEYLAAKTVLKELVGSQWDDDFRIPISLMFVSQHMDQDHTLWISIIHELVRALSDPHSVAGRAFCLDTVSVNLATLSVMAFTEQLVTKLIEGQIIVPQLQLNLALNDAFSIASTINTTSVIGPEGSFTDHQFVDELVLQGSSGPSQFASWCSAVARAQCLRQLRLRKAFADQVNLDRALQWRWLAYAMSNRHWRISIRHLRIEEEILRVDDADNFICDGVDGDDSQPPREDQADEHIKAVQLFSRSIVRLSTGTEMELELLAWSEGDEFLVLSEDPEDEEWISILVPGFGRCSVQCESVANVRLLQQRSNVRSKYELQSLQLHLDQAEPLAIPRFVQNIGASLTRLNIELKEDVTPEPTDIRTMLRHCPVLEFLALKRFNISSMDVLRDAYRASECRIGVLSLWNVWVDNSSLNRFAWELADRKSKLNFHLHEFRYIYDDLEEEDAVSRPDADGVDAFIAMMSVNTTLSFLEIGVEEQIRATRLPQFELLDNDRPIATVPAAAKMSLLSVVTEPESQVDDTLHLKKQKHALKWLPTQARASVLPLIWSFLAATPTRKIVVTPTRITANAASYS